MFVERLIDRDSVVLRCKDMPFAEVEGEVLILNAEAGRYHGLNNIASDIWRRLEKPVRVADLCASLTEDYKGDAAVIERDVLDFLHQLVARGVVRSPEAG